MPLSDWMKEGYLIVFVEPWSTVIVTQQSFLIYIERQPIPAPGECLLHSDHRGPRLNKCDPPYPC